MGAEEDCVQKSCEVVSDLLGAQWKFAKTMAKTNPHWYTLRKTWDDERFIRAVKHIRDVGYDMQWRDQRTYTVMNINETRVWTMGSPIRPWAEVVAAGCTNHGETRLINCARRELVYEPRERIPMDNHDKAKIAAMIGPLPGSTLDINCGDGLLLDLCEVNQFSGCEPVFDRARALKAKHQEVSLKCCTFEDYYSPYPFDAVVALAGEASRFPVAYLQKLRYLLRRDGRYFLMFDREQGCPLPNGEPFGDFIIARGTREQLNW